MAKRGRKPLLERPVQLKIYLPESLYAILKMELWDPTLETIQYGAVSKLVTQLLRTYLDNKELTCTTSNSGTPAIPSGLASDEPEPPSPLGESSA